MQNIIIWLEEGKEGKEGNEGKEGKEGRELIFLVILVAGGIVLYVAWGMMVPKWVTSLNELWKIGLAMIIFMPGNK